MKSNHQPSMTAQELRLLETYTLERGKQCWLKVGQQQFPTCAVQNNPVDDPGVDWHRQMLAKALARFLAHETKEREAATLVNYLRGGMNPDDNS